MRTHPNSNPSTALVIASFLSAAVLFLSTGCSKKPAPDISGYWLGKITVNGITLTLGIDITKVADGRLAATFDSLDQGVRDIPVPEITYSNGNLNLGMKALAASYEGKIDSTGRQIAGTWTQLRMNTPLVWERSQKPAAPDTTAVDKNYEPRAGSEIQGLWKGTLSLGQAQMRLVFKIAESPDGKFSGVMDSVDQGARNFPFSAITYVKPTLDIELQQIAGNFNGKLEADGREIVGDWEQGGRVMPLTLTRANAGEFAPSTDASVYEWKNESEPQGIWSGALTVQGTTLRLTMKVARGSDGKLSGSMDSIDQGARDLPMNIITFEDGTMHMEWQALRASFHGELSDGKLVGHWRQGGVGFPLTLERKKAVAPR